MAMVGFGEIEMAPVLRATDSKEIQLDGNDNHTNTGTVISDATMPEADEPACLEKTPMLSLLKSEGHVINACILGINKIQLNKRSYPRFMFVVLLKWSDGSTTFVSRDHDDFFRYHCWLLDTFRSDAGVTDKQRTIPMFPGKKLFRNSLELAEQRQPLIEAYLNGLTKLAAICDSYLAQAFFGARPGDPEDNDVILLRLRGQTDTQTDTKTKREEMEPGHDQDGVNQGNVVGSFENLTFQHEHGTDKTNPDTIQIDLVIERGHQVNNSSAETAGGGKSVINTTVLDNSVTSL